MLRFDVSLQMQAISSPMQERCVFVTLCEVRKAIYKTYGYKYSAKTVYNQGQDRLDEAYTAYTTNTMLAKQAPHTPGNNATNVRARATEGTGTTYR